MKKILKLLVVAGKWALYYALVFATSIASYTLIFRPDKEE